MIRFILPDLRRLESTIAETVVLFRFSERVPFRGVASLIDWRLHGHLSRMTIEGFFTGDLGEPMLMPLCRFLPQRFLLVVGLGEKEKFSNEVFDTGLDRAFELLDGLDTPNIVLALPGRVENACPGSDAIDWFIDRYDAAPHMRECHIVEPPGAQKTMVPAVERWRLRHLVP